MSRFWWAACAALISTAPALAQQDTPPVPKMFQGMQGEKGQWQMEMLEAPGKAGRMPTMTICTDNLMRDPSAAQKKRGEAGCKYRLLKDTPNEAVMESVCKERKNTVTMTREGPKSMLMSIESEGPRGERQMKMRYTHLGPCAEGQGAVTFDKNSEQCKKMRAQAAKMDPEKACARSKGDREACEEKVRQAKDKMAAMCPG